MQKVSRIVQITLGLALLLVPLAGWGQGNNWKYLTGANLRGVKAIGNHAWAVGDRGLILHTSDGGDAWEIQVSNTAQDLNGVTFSSDRHGWAVGGGVILKTTNGGTTWQNLPVPRPWLYYRACSVDSMHCVMTAWTDSVVRTTDGGNTFTVHSVSGVNTYFVGITFTDSLRGWTVAGIGVLFIAHTTDGGVSWSNQMPGFGEATDITMRDSLEGWAVGPGGQIFHTINAWNTVSVQPSGTGAFLNTVSFNQMNTGLIAGGQNGFPATILWTTNGGNTWNARTDLSRNLEYFGASLSDSVKGLISGESGSLILTTNAGQIWRVLKNLDARGQTMFNIAMADTQAGYAVGPYGIVVKTTNGGTLWQRQVAVPNTLWWYGVDTPDPSYAWICGDGGSIYATKNGGASWVSQPSGVSWFLNSVDMVDTLFGVSVGGGTGPYGGEALGVRREAINDSMQNAKCKMQSANWTTNGEIDNPFKPWESPLVIDKWQHVKEGEKDPQAQYRVITRTFDGTNWQGQTTSATPLTGVSFANKRLGWAVGVSGTVIHTSDSGATWQAQTSNVPNTLYWVIFPTATYGWAVGTGGTIIATTDGGNTWNRQTSNTIIDLYSAAFVDAQRGWVVGDSGLALETTNGGQTWFFDTTRTKIPLFATRFTDLNHGWAIGGFGLTLGYGRAGIPGVEIQPEGSRQLAVGRIKAYPNPFISFAHVPGHEKELFALYDIMGRKMGDYTGERIGADIASGIYFLIAEGKEGRPTRIVKVK